MARNETIENGELTDTSFYILLSLIEARHGYRIMQKIEEITESRFTIGPASMYTTIKKLVSAGLIELTGNGTGKRKTYIITNKGMSVLKTDIKRRENMLSHAKYMLEEKGDV